MSPSTAAALVIGNELLTGKIAEQNLAPLAQFLRARGVVLKRASFVLDDVGTIAAEVRALSRSHDWVFTSGGVGPTHDDVTIDAVAEAFGVPVVTDDRLAQMLRDHYAERLAEGHLLMARIPKGAKLVSSEAVPWPVTVMGNVWVLPGVPQVFRAKLALVAAELGQGRPFISVALITDLDEGNLKPLIDRVVAAYPDVEVGSYPRWEAQGYRTRLTFDGQDEPRVRAAQAALAETLPATSLRMFEG